MTACPVKSLPGEIRRPFHRGESLLNRAKRISLGLFPNDGKAQ